MKAVCVFCGSHVGEQQDYLESAAELGAYIAEKNMKLVYGGASVGLMGKVANACLEAGGEVIGVMPQKLVRMEIAHPGLTDLKVVDDMHQRKAVMAELSDVCVALPGGIGTLEETFEVFAWTQLGLQEKPIGLVNTLGYYDLLYAFLQNVVNQGFMRDVHLEMLLIDSDVKSLIDSLMEQKIKVVGKWADKEKNRIK